MLFRFCYEMQVGDYVVYPSKIDRKINLGVVESDYMYVPDAAGNRAELYRGLL